MTRLAIVLQDRQYIAVIGDFAGRRLGGLPANDRAANRLGRGLPDFLAGQDIFQRFLQIEPRDLLFLLEPRDVFVINPASVTQHELPVEDKCRWRDLRPQCVGLRRVSRL